MTDKYSLIIFDCDGTLVDSEKLNNIAVSECLMGLGMSKYTPEYCLTNLAGHSRQYVTKLIIDELGYLPDFVKLAEGINKRCLELHHTELSAVEGMAELLSSLTIPTAVASNGNRVAVLNSLKVSNLSKFFNEEHIFTGEMVTQGKPHPDIYLLAAKTCGVSPARCLVIEDSQAGIQAAKAAGMDVLGFCGASHNTPETYAKLVGTQPNGIIKNAMEIIGFLQ
jgi:HAD superfamily hydrolase (TIGR01509 family)